MLVLGPREADLSQETRNPCTAAVHARPSRQLSEERNPKGLSRDLGRALGPADSRGAGWTAHRRLVLGGTLACGFASLLGLVMSGFYFP